MSEQDVIDKIQDVLNKCDDLEAKINEVKTAVELDKNKYRKCSHCTGTGSKASHDGSESCPDCGGDGRIEDGWISKD